MPGGRRQLVVGLAALLAAAVVTGALLALSTRGSDRQAAVAPSVRSKLGLVTLQRTAPGFTLTDQRGRAISLRSLRGRVVVLDFFDPVCTDICPIVSQEYVQAARLLGKRMDRVAFLAVNVNQYHERVADVARFSRAHGLDRIAGFHFLTGSTRALRTVWKAYDVTVQPNPKGDVVHSSLLYFIGPDGRSRYLALPRRVQGADMLGWAHGIAAVVRSLDR